MKKLTMLSVLSALLLSTAVSAEPYWANKPVQCADEKEVISQVVLLGEKPIIIFEGTSVHPNGKARISKFVIATNQKTMTWTLLEFPVGSGQGCILGSGIGNILGSGNEINI
tara:strand:+ start:48 stop:383 length:336 start_codon:yes stop_codon:yes gene_type:complete